MNNHNKFDTEQVLHDGDVIIKDIFCNRTKIAVRNGFVTFSSGYQKSRLNIETGSYWHYYIQASTAFVEGMTIGDAKERVNYYFS